MSRAEYEMSRGNYESAIQTFFAAEKQDELTPDLKAKIFYLRAICYKRIGRYDVWEGAYKYIIKEFPQSKYARDAVKELNAKQSVEYDILEAILRRELPVKVVLNDTEIIHYLSFKADSEKSRNEFMKRFAGFGPRIRHVSDADSLITGVIDKYTGEPGIIISAGEITWINDSEVMASGGYYRNGRYAGSNTYYLRNVKGSWIIIKVVKGPVS